MSVKFVWVPAREDKEEGAYLNGETAIPDVEAMRRVEALCGQDPANYGSAYNDGIEVHVEDCDGGLSKFEVFVEMSPSFRARRLP